jgi:hypothetical protein
MPGTHPSFPGSGPIFQAAIQLRRSFPAQVTADTLKRLGLAPGNESRIISVLKFLGIIDEEGNRTDAGKRVFAIHDDTEFGTAFGELVRQAYSDLFDLHGEASWTLDRSKLISYFRQADQTSALVGQRQATTFQALAALAGHAEVPTKKSEGEPHARQRRAKRRPSPEQEQRTTVSPGDAANPNVNSAPRRTAGISPSPSGSR